MKQNKDSESWPKAIKGISLKFNRKRNASICGTHPACLEKKKRTDLYQLPNKDCSEAISNLAREHDNRRIPAN